MTPKKPLPMQCSSINFQLTWILFHNIVNIVTQELRKEKWDTTQKLQKWMKQLKSIPIPLPDTLVFRLMTNLVLFLQCFSIYV